MKLHLIINHSRPPYISQSIAFLDEKNCQEYMTLNQKNLAHKSLQLSKYLIDVRGELAPNQRMIYALFDLNDSAHYTDNIIPGIKRARHIEGFYADETALYMAENDMPKEIFYTKQMDFSTKYLENIKISESDNEKTKELKKIKKIILFEVTHEDAKPFMPEIILNALIRKERGETKFELPYIDSKTHYMDIIDVLDTEISTLSYVRNKLQCGFYDKIDNQSIYIVNPKYRKSEYIAEAAYEMVYELSIMLNKKVTVDFDYLLQRVCSVGPNNIYSPVQEDENIQKYTDGAEFLNPKRYQIK